MLGDGTASAALAGQAPIRGIAHKARLVFQAVEQALDWKNPAHLERYGRYLLAGIPADISTIFHDAYLKGARIHSNSWGGGEPGAYDSQSRQLDQFVWDHPTMCILVAAGNDGSDSDGNGEINFGSVTSPGTAKNCITVGASENLRHAFDTETYGAWWPRDYPAAPYKNGPMADDPDQVVAFSSRGPTADGRVKPEVVAPGTWILSTKSTMLSTTANGWRRFPQSSKYFYMGGTSMATPLTAGAIGGHPPAPASRSQDPQPDGRADESVVIAGAFGSRTPLPSGTVVDNHQGFGRVDLAAVVKPPAGTTLWLRQNVERGNRSEPAHERHGEDGRFAAADRARLLRLPRSEPGEQPQPRRDRTGRYDAGRQPTRRRSAHVRHVEQRRRSCRWPARPLAHGRST